mgnify:CR=1 FL=1
MSIKHIVYVLCWLVMMLVDAHCHAQKMVVMTNPLNLSYRFQTEGVCRRETADPVVVYCKNNYYLFASHSSGYWYSPDLRDWTYVATRTLKAVESWAPAVMVYNDAVYYVGMGEERAFRSTDPMNDCWEKIAFDFHGMGDPAFFQDTDGKVYMYYGCSDWTPIKGAQVDPENNFRIIGKEIELIPHNSTRFGWEVFGDNNELYDKKGWNEAPCITKQGDYYYLMYAAPGTEFISYCTATYVSKNPLGPYVCMQSMPFAIKADGFVRGAGHGHPFKDCYGNNWYVATIVMASKEHYERRVGIYPAVYKDGTAFACTDFMDYPFALPNKKVDFDKYDVRLNMNLLSYGKAMTASSARPGYGPEKATDEDIRTWWSAISGKKGEWLQMDLGCPMTIEALQISFSDDGFQARRFDRDIPVYQYIVEYSTDGNSWYILADRSQNTKDQIYELVVIDKPVNARYVRVKNTKDFHIGNFSVADIRLFGQGGGKASSVVSGFQALRDQDRRRMSFSWNEQNNASGYVIRWGTSPKKLHCAVTVHGNCAEFGCFDTVASYYVTIEAFNESGKSKALDPIKVN